METPQIDLATERPVPVHPPPQQKNRCWSNIQQNWWLYIAGGLVFFSFLALFVGWGSLKNRNAMQTQAVAAELEAEPDAEPETVAAELEAEPDAEPEAVADPATAASEEPMAATDPAPVADPTHCRFLNGNRPKVGEKYILTCTEGQFVATGEYKSGGVYVFSAFETHSK